MENATAADSSQSNISRIYIWKDNMTNERTYDGKNIDKKKSKKTTYNDGKKSWQKKNF